MFGREVKAVKKIRKELGEFVDEGRGEGRRPELSGEVSNRLARRIRKLMGGDVELSYPVLGPDNFVVDVLKAQAKRHQNRRRIDIKTASAKALVQAVFKANEVDPDLAKKRVRSQTVARCRAMVAWIWVELFGWPMVEVAEDIGAAPCSVSVMMSKLRREGLSRKETLQVNRIAKSFSEGERSEQLSEKVRLQSRRSKTGKASVFVLRRNRKRK